jgi:regulator of protease activity HflC (stomatin/prohibitin superfamily)
MDRWFIVFIIAGAITLLAGFAIAFTEDDDRATVIKTTVVLGFITGALLFISSFTVVGTKTVGITTNFGKPGAVLNNGWHWKNPAAQVHKFDASLQSDHYSSDKDDAGEPITVRLYTGSQAQLNVTFQWKLQDSANFVQVFQNYREPEKIQQNLVKRALQQALNDGFAQYNPYAALIAAQQSGTTTPGTVQVSSNFDQMGQDALSRLKAELASQGVDAVSLTIASISYDAKTQGNLDGLSSAIAQTQIAVQNEKTADAQANANSKLNASSASGATIQQLCIQATQKVLEEGHTLPAGWTCTGTAPATVVPTH